MLNTIISEQGLFSAFYYVFYVTLSVVQVVIYDLVFA